MRHLNRFYLLCTAAAILLVTAGARAQSVTGFTLINADTDAPVAAFDPLNNGAVIDLDDLTTGNLNIRANTSGTVGSVKFGLDGTANYRTESAAPYALEGDTDGDYKAWNPSEAEHTVTATPYSEASAGGTAGTAVTITFTVTRGGGSSGGSADPTVSAGSDRSLILPSNSVTLTGSASDADGSIASYAWTKESGPAATMGGAATATLALSGLVEGSYVFRLTVTDNEDNTAYDEASVTVYAAGGAGGIVTGELKKWHKVTVTFDGPASSEDAATNPFTDYRLNVVFTNGSRTYTVPGYYAADGDAAETSADSGNKWRVHFCPDATGTWNYVASFRTGTDVAVNASATAGTATAFDGATGSFSIGASDKTGRDLRGKGRLQYVGERYLQFAESGDYFLKQGADAPENMLAYADFDGSFKNDGIYRTQDFSSEAENIKTWSAHVQDWNTGDPVWQGSKGKGLIGAVNYLASEGMNAFSFLTMNINGDDRNVFPYTSYTERYRMDCSRLDQWEVIFAHADEMGMYLHFKTQETENDQLLDGGDLGTQRKLYYRELIARFGHHLALNWNLGEENTQSEAQRKAMAQYFYDNDPYRHNVVLHTYPGQKSSVYTPLLGSASKLTGLSLQMSQANFSDVHSQTAEWVGKAETAGKPWVVAVDEPGDASHALRPDDDAGSSHTDGRKNGIWGTFMAGGAGNEWYFGYNHAHSDMTCQDFHSRDAWWDYCRYALEFFENNDVPFWTMDSDNSLSSASDDYCFAKPGSVYVVYLKNGGTSNLTVTGGDYTVKWYDPRNGGSLRDGSVTAISGAGAKSLGTPPSSTTSDWVALVTADGSGGSTGGGTYPADAFVEQNGVVVFEAESAPVVSGWSSETSVSGYSGTEYYVGTMDRFSSPGTGLLEYPVYLTATGTYQLQWRSRIVEGTSSTDCNDTWARLVDESGTPVTPVANDLVPTGTWYKIYMNRTGAWVWDASNHDNNAKAVAWQLQAGKTYTFQASVRSKGHALDKIVLYDVDRYAFANESTGKGANATALNALPVSQQGGTVSVPHPAVPEKGHALSVLGAEPIPAGRPLAVGYTLARTADVNVTVYDAQGTPVATLVDGTVPSGAHAAVWSGSMVPGVYAVVLRTADGLISTKRIVIIR